MQVDIDQLRRLVLKTHGKSLALMELLGPIESVRQLAEERLGTGKSAAELLHDLCQRRIRLVEMSRQKRGAA